MKRLIVVLVLLFIGTAMAQEYYMTDGLGKTRRSSDGKEVQFVFPKEEQYSIGETMDLWKNDIWKSEWKLDTVLNIGDVGCNHSWVTKNIKEPSMISCLVNHDSRGCPNNWGREEWICELCLRNIIMWEDRTIIPEIEKSKSKFDLLKEKINKQKESK